MTNYYEVIQAKNIRMNKIMFTVLNYDGTLVNYKPYEIVSYRKNDDMQYFNYDKDGLTDYLVMKIDSTSREKIYKKTINGIKETYKNPDEVIKTTIENDYVRIEGVEMNGLQFKGLGASFENLIYVIEISFKDGKYKFEPINMSFYATATSYSSGGNINIALNNGMGYTNKKGKIRESFSAFPKNIEDVINNLNLSLYEYILKGSSKKYDEDW